MIDVGKIQSYQELFCLFVCPFGRSYVVCFVILELCLVLFVVAALFRFTLSAPNLSNLIFAFYTSMALIMNVPTYVHPCPLRPMHLYDTQYKEKFGITPFFLSLPLSAISRFILLSTIVYTLKEYAEQRPADVDDGQLLPSNKTTLFAQLNYLVAAWAFLGTFRIFKDFFFQKYVLLACLLLTNTQ